MSPLGKDPFAEEGITNNSQISSKAIMEKRKAAIRRFEELPRVEIDKQKGHVEDVFTTFPSNSLTWCLHEFLDWLEIFGHFASHCD